MIGCGMPKSGTTSLATMLAPVLRTRHEFAMTEAAQVRLREQSGEWSAAQVREWLVERDERCNAEVDSTSFLWVWSGQLPDVFPEARFVATVRAPDDWCRSLAGMLLAMAQVSPDERAWGTALGLGDAGREPLVDPGAYVRAALDYWRLSADAIAALPPARTWWCRTVDLTPRADELAAWVGVHPDWLRRVPANRSRSSAAAVQAALPADAVAAEITPEDRRRWARLEELAGAVPA